MSIKRRYVDLINEKLMFKRSADDISITLNIPEHKFKKHADKLNWALMDLYKQYSSQGTMMYHMILSLQDYFDVVWLMDNVLSDEIKNIIIPEMSSEHGITLRKK